MADDLITVQAFADAMASVPPEYAANRGARSIWIDGYMAGALASEPDDSGEADRG